MHPGPLLRWGTAILIVTLVAVATASEPVRDALLAAVAWCAESGVAGIVVFGCIYTVCCLLVLPAAVLTVAAGWAWGLVDGTLIVLGVSLFADWLPFAVARRLGRERVERATRHRALLRALDSAFRTHGFGLVALTRLSPVAPYNVTNYLLGLMPVTTVTYLTASLIGSLPSTVLEVYLGTLVRGDGDVTDVSVFDNALGLAVAAGLTVAATVGLALLGRRALRRIVRDDAAAMPEPA